MYIYYIKGADNPVVFFEPVLQPSAMSFCPIWHVCCVEFHANTNTIGIKLALHSNQMEQKYISC